MNVPERPRILIVDDEEAILETIALTFEDDYEVLTAPDATRALELLDQHAPVSVVISDQRMPSMSGVTFLAKVYERHPSAVRIILTGFADMDAIIEAINDGHVYAYITKPWEPDDLKQVVRQAVERHRLSVENERLVADLQRSNALLEAVMDRLDTGAVAVDAAGLIQAANQPAREIVGLSGDLRGRSLKETLEEAGLTALADAAGQLAVDPKCCSEDLELRRGGHNLRLRVAVHQLVDPRGEAPGRVIFWRETSHEPLRRKFEQILEGVSEADGPLRERLEQSVSELHALAEEVHSAHVESTEMADLAERISRSETALENWLAVDDALGSEDYPDAQLLRDRMRVAMTRWTRPDQVPERVRALAHRVEAYYESGENPKQRVL